MTRRTPRFCPFVEILESRVTPDAFQVNDSGDQPWDSSKYPNDALTTGGMYTLRSVLGYAQAKNKSAEVTFAGPMTINVGSLLPSTAVGQPLTLTGPDVAAFEAPKVSIVGSGQTHGFFVRTGSAVRNVRVAGFEFNLDFESGASGVTVERCFIGTDEGGTGKGPDDKFGIFVYNNVSNSDIRDNVVSGNSYGGIYVGSSTNVRIERNRVGTDPAGKQAVGNGYGNFGGFGIQLSGGSGNKIAGNTVGGQVDTGGFGRGQGIYLNSVSDSMVDDNRVGVGIDGSILIPNGVGISVNNGTRVEVGTTKGNVVAGNAKYGVTVDGTECKVVGNFIGVTKTGESRPNGGNGVEVSGTKHTIGGSEAGKGNVIAANKGAGVYVFGDEITVQGNHIGTTPAGDELGNGRYGVQIIGSKNVIGADATGTDPAAGNTIAYNGADLGLKGHGVVVSGTGRTKNAIRLNTIFMNKGRGIDLGGDAWYRNDPRDADSGNNDLLNHPTVIGVFGDTVRWMLNAPSDTKFTVDVYRDPDNGFTEYAEGKDHLQTLTVTTDVTGHVEFETQGGGDRVTATATDAAGNTSTFSLADADADGLCDTWETDTGLDLNDDGTAEYVPPGANRLRKDVYVEYVSMTGWGPLSESLGRVIVAFAGSPVFNPAGGPGITLHLEPGNQAVPPADFDGANSWAPLHAVKQAHFANGSGPGSDLYKAKLLVSRFALFGVSHPFQRGSSGVSELIGNDLMISLGGWFGQVPDGTGGMRPRTAAEAASGTTESRVGVIANQAGTLIHELGHALGLGHTGPVDWLGVPKFAVTEYDPLYRSTMNYIYQAPDGRRYSGTQILDYSASAPNEWDNLWFAFQENAHAASGSDLSAEAPTDAPNELPTLAPTDCDLTAVVFPPPRLDVGVPTSITVTVLNNGLATAADSTLTLAIPDGFEIGAVTPSRGTATISGRTIVVRFGAIDGADGATVSVELTPTQGGVATLTGQLSTTTSDGLPANNTTAVVLAVGTGVSPPPPPLPPPPPPTGPVTRYAAAAGPGGGPHVKVFDGATQVASFFAYDPTFTGGVHVATADVTGDGVPDVITAAGAGGGPHVKVFDGVTFQLVREFFAYDAGFGGGVNVAVGDVNADGVADIVTGAGAGGGSHVKVFDGATGRVLQEFMAFDVGFRGGVNVAVGDVTGDGVPEIVAGAGAGGGPHVKAFDSRTSTLRHDLFAFEGSFRGGVNVTVSDPDGDGRADLIVAAGAGGGPHVKAFRGTDFATLSESFAFDPAFRGGAFVG